MGKDAAYLARQKRIVSQQRRAIAAKTAAGSGKKAPARSKPKDRDGDYIPDDEEEEEDDDGCSIGDETEEGEGDGQDLDGKSEDEDEPPTKRKKKTKSVKKGRKKEVKPKKPRKPSAAKVAKEKVAVGRRVAAESRCIDAAAAEVEGAIAHAAAREMIKAACKKSQKRPMLVTSNSKRVSASVQRESADQAANESPQRTVQQEAHPPCLEHDPTACPEVASTIQPDAHTTCDRVANTACSSGVSNATSDNSQPRTPDRVDGTNLTSETQKEAADGAFDMLDSDCDDTGPEICFFDDDDEILRSREERHTPDDWEIASDEMNVSNGSSEENDPGGESDVVDTAGEEPTSVGFRQWHELEKSEMVEFAKDDLNMADMRANGWLFDPDEFPPTERYPGLCDDEYGPTDTILELADSPLQLFFFFLPKQFWKDVAQESNRYFLQNLTSRVDRMFENQRTPTKRSKEEILVREAKKPEILPHEILHVLGLLMARMMNPHRRRFRDHWSTERLGAVPRGTFNDYMPRHRFEHIMANIHFTNNADVRAASDRAWKVRSVVDTLQRTFPLGYKTPPVISFDEGIIPSRNRNNPTRQYLKAKPHKWGTKLFLTCCAETAYCMRLEVYCGKAQHTAEVGNVPASQLSADPNAGPSAVIRNLEAVLPAARDGVYHLVVTDRFYTSVQLPLQLLHRNIYSIGTIMGDKVGYPKEIVEKNRDRPKNTPHGTVRMAVAKPCPAMTGLVWWDRKPVQFLGTGASRTIETCQRRTRGSRGRRQVIPCPSMVRDYHRWMGGVDIHDQLRLQRYSLQLQTWCKKYYKAIFMGLVDVAIVNAYIVFRESQKRSEAQPVTHAEFLMQLHADLMILKEADFVERDGGHEDDESAELAPLPTEHEPEESPDYQVVNGVRKRRQRQCKVCSIMKHKIGERRATKYFCAACSPSETARTYLCNKSWKHYPGNSMTCFQIWHQKWHNGTKRPHPRCGRDIQNRAAGSRSGGNAARKRKRRQHTSDDEDLNEDDDAEEAAIQPSASQSGGGDASE